MSDQTGLQQFWQDFNDLDQDIEYFVTARLFEGTPAIWPREHRVRQMASRDCEATQT